ncbi:hypothetical protein ACFYSC_16155 [Streptosporangium sp. NPDC004379]|uniref:hypothetical protein n=1 Tax=Streptosporangium sp. NPDC004379 TaxID=3366189 RepID=UPI003681FC25
MVVSIRRCVRPGGILRALYSTVLGAAVLLHLVLCSHAHSAHVHSAHAHSAPTHSVPAHSFHHHRHELRTVSSGETCHGEARGVTTGPRSTAGSLVAAVIGPRLAAGSLPAAAATAAATGPRTVSGYRAIARHRTVSGAVAYCGGTPCPLRPLLPAGEDHTLCGAAAGPSITILRVLLPAGRAACDAATAEVTAEAPAVPAARRASRPVRPLPGAALLLLKSVSRV